MKQHTIDFNGHHGKENNMLSQALYESKLDKFNNQCKILMEYFLTGKTLTFKEAFINLNISDLRRRVKDLKDVYNVPVKDRMLTGGFKEWYLDQDYIKQF